MTIEQWAEMQREFDGFAGTLRAFCQAKGIPYRTGRKNLRATKKRQVRGKIETAAVEAAQQIIAKEVGIEAGEAIVDVSKQIKTLFDKVLSQLLRYDLTQCTLPELGSMLRVLGDLVDDLSVAAPVANAPTRPPLSIRILDPSSGLYVSPLEANVMANERMRADSRIYGDVLPLHLRSPSPVPVETPTEPPQVKPDTTEPLPEAKRDIEPPEASATPTGKPSEPEKPPPYVPKRGKPYQWSSERTKNLIKMPTERNY